MSCRSPVLSCLLLGVGLAACPPAKDTDTGIPVEETAESGDTGEGTDTAGDTGDTEVPPPAGPLLVLAGGGSEGDEGDATSWSARLYGALLSRGDVTGDGQVRVAVLSAEDETEWIPEYLVWLGADAAYNVKIATVAAADDPALEDTLGTADAVFLKGGDQGVYYDLWNDRRVEDLIRRVADAGGAIGGTSAGAMSQGQYALAGGQDYVSLDALQDACTPYLDDLDGGSGIHDDFLGLVPGVLVDTHYTQRARLGRLAGAMARVMEEEALPGILGIGLDEQTGIVVEGGMATVVGQGSVSFLRPGPGASLDRTCGAPLVWTDLELDRLTDGWSWSLDDGAVAAPPSEAEPVTWDGVTEDPPAGEWFVDGDRLAHEEGFAWVVERDPRPYGTHAGSADVVLPGTTGAVNAQSEDTRAAADEAVFRALYDHPGASGFLVAQDSSLERGEDPARVLFVPNPYTSDPEASTLVVDSSGVTWRSLSPVPSSLDTGDGSLHAAGLAGLRVHLLADSDGRGLAYDVVLRQVTGR